MDRAKVVEDDFPPAEVITHFDGIFQLEQVPRALAQVGFLHLLSLSLKTAG
jgi:hypothetical protein